MELTSPHNEFIKTVAALMTDGKQREKLHCFVIEGTVTILAAVALGIVLRGVVAAESYSEPLPDAKRVYRVSDAVFKKISGTVSPQGILAVIDSFDRELSDPKGNALILDGIRDPGNMGTLIRTAAALGIRDLYCADCVDPTNPKCVRASMSGIFHVVCHQASREEIIKAIKPACSVLVADMGGVNLFSLVKSGKPFALVVGNEAHGVSSYFRNQADQIVALPMQNVESLNAAVSASVILYQLIHAK